MFPWYWLADRWAQEGLPCGLGHALSRKAIPGGQAKNDKIDAHTIAVLRRGGMLPQASVYPAAMRATRARRRRRMPLMRTRAELLTHLQNTNSQSNLPEIGKKIADKANRAGVAERFADPAVPKSLEVDLALISHDDSRLRDMAWSVLTTAKEHHTHPLCLRRTVPGLGEILSLVLRYDSHEIHRFPRGQDVVSYCRLVKCAKESAGKRYGTGGTKLGKADLKGACSEAAVLVLRDKPSGQKDLTRLEKTHGKGTALPGLAQHVARAVYSLRKRATAFQMDKFIHGERRGAGEPDAYLDSEGMRLDRAR
jgi:transposase